MKYMLGVTLRENAMPFRSPTTLDLSGIDYLLPDEDPAIFVEFRDELLEELAPRRPIRNAWP